MRRRRLTGTAFLVVGLIFFVDALRFAVGGPSDERAWHVFGTVAAVGLIGLGIATLRGTRFYRG